MRDITKPIKYDVKHNGTISLGDRGKKAGFKITGAVDRFEYGLNMTESLKRWTGHKSRDPNNL